MRRGPLVIGAGIQALVGFHGLKEAGPQGGNNLLLLAAELDGSDPRQAGALLTFISCAAFLTVMASASVMLLAGSAAVVHDLRGDRRPRAAGAARSPGALQARLALVGIGAVCVLLAVMARDTNAQFWLSLTYLEVASALVPALCYSLLWKRFTVTGLRWCVYGGTALMFLLLALSPAVSGSPDSLFPDSDWQLVPLRVPGLISIPAGFLLGALGSRRRVREPVPVPA